MSREQVNSLSETLIIIPFMLLLSLVTSRIPSTNSRTNQPQIAEQINHKQPNKLTTNSRKASFHIENQLNITIFTNV